MFCGIVTYCLALVLSGQAPSFASWIGLRGGAKSLYGGGQVEVFGPHLIVMAITVSSIAFGLQGVRRRSTTDQERSFRIIILSIGFWMLAILGRYLLLPRPIDLPPLFIPSSIAFLLIVGHLRIENRNWGQLSDRLRVLPLLFIASLPLAALWNFPDPQDELKRISGRYVNTTNWSSTPGRVSDGWSPDALSKYDDFITVTSVLTERIRSKDSSIGYFGIFGHTIELLNGIDNVLGIPAPESLRFGDSQEKLACVPVESRKPQFVIVYAPTFPCLNYKLNSEYSLEKFPVYERVIDPTSSP
jgi:hypothetical protein